MFLHALQQHFGYLSAEGIEWTAAKLGLQPINIYELVTFYPMFRQQRVGKYQLKVCRTLSCERLLRPPASLKLMRRSSNLRRVR